MQLEAYFDFLSLDDIRLKGTRIGIESVLLEYLHNARTPEEIAARFPTLTLEQVYATILYYLHNQEPVNTYLTDYLDWANRTREEASQNSSPGKERLLTIKSQLEGLCGEERDSKLRRILAQEAEQGQPEHANST